MPAKTKLTDAQVKKIRRRVRAGAQFTALAAEYGVNRKTIRRRLDALELCETERAPNPERTPEVDARQRERPDPPPRSEERPETSGLALPAEPAAAEVSRGGVPLFPSTPAGQAARLAYYEARKLNHLPDSLLDYHDVIRGRETPVERRARKAHASGRRR